MPHMARRTTALSAVVIVSALTASIACRAPIDPVGSTTVTTPITTSPANGALIADNAQPVTLTVKNAFVGNPSASVRYGFEVANDAGFVTIVQTRDVSQGSESTSTKLDALPAGKDYFWRVRTTADNTSGEYTAPLKFTIGPAAPPAISN